MLPRFSFRLGLGLAFVVAAAISGPMVLVGDARSAYDAAQLIAFTRADGIYVIRADGSDERPLRRGGVAANVSGLAWSPDGRRLAFAGNGGGIWAMAADGSNLVRLVAPRQISAKAWGPLSWSPLGRKIAFTAFGAGARNDIWLVNADGTHAHQLTRTPNRYEFQVDWSPYGDRIAFADPSGEFLRLYVMNTNGRHLHAINPGWIFQAAMPRWSPQSTRLAFMGWLGSAYSNSMRGAEIWVTDANGRYFQRLTHNTVIDSHPSWSSDGSKIVFIRGRKENLIWVSPEKRSTAEIYVMNDDGTGVTRLTHNRVGEGSPAWQPVASS